MGVVGAQPEALGLAGLLQLSLDLTESSQAERLLLSGEGEKAKGDVAALNRIQPAEELGRAQEPGGRKGC